MSLVIADYISIPRHPLISATIFADTFFYLSFLLVQLTSVLGYATQLGFRLVWNP
jgi:hypothetical protein